MKKIKTLLVLMMCAVCANAAQINASDYDFGVVSIKGQSMVYGTAEITVSWAGLPTDGGGRVDAEVVEGEADPNGFYISGDDYVLVGYGSSAIYSTTFEIGYMSEQAGVFNGKIRFYGYDSSYTNEVEKIINVTVNITDGAVVAQTSTYERLNNTSDVKEGDVVVFVDEVTGSVSGSLYQTYLTAITENVKIDKTKGTAEIPDEAESFTLSKYNGNWQFTNTRTNQRLLLDISGKGAFSYGEPTSELLAGWGISISNGYTWVARPSDETFPVRFNSDRFKPYKSETAGTDIWLYKKVSGSHDITSSLSISPDKVDFGELELAEQKTVEVSYTAENLTDDIAWGVEGADAALFDVKDTGDRNSGKVSVSYLGTGTKTGAVIAELVYLTQNASLDDMSGSFPIVLTLKGNTVKLTKIEFDNTAYSVNLGETLDLSKHITLTPSDAADKSLKWETSNSAWATINDNGVLTPLLSGDVTVTVSSVVVPEVKATCKVTIILPAAQSIELSQTAMTIGIGDQPTLTAKVLPAGADQAVNFSSDNTSVATVNKNGVITAKALGTAVITVSAKSDANIKATCTVTVSATAVESIAFNPAAISLTLGSTVQLAPVVLPAQAALDNAVSYESDDETVVSVTAEGLATALAEGTAVITATCGGKQAQLTISVVGAVMFTKVTDPAVLKDRDTIIIAAKGFIGESPFAVVAGPRNDKKGLTPLTENITITDDAAAGDEALRIVLGAVSGGFTLTPVGASKALAEKNNDLVDANTQNNKVWKFVADENGVYIQNVGNTNALFRYHKENTNIKPYKPSTVGAVTLYTYLRAYREDQPQEVKVTGVKLNKQIIGLEIGETFQLVATVQPSNATNKKVTWKSADESVVTVSANGLLTAVAEGETKVTVKTEDGGFTAECVVKVVTVQHVTGVSLSENSLKMYVGDQHELTASIEPENAADNTVTWSSSDESVVTVIDGTVTALAAGTAVITVTTNEGGFTDQCEVTVAERPTEQAPVPTFSVESGEVENGTELVITAAEPTDILHYSFNRGPWEQTQGEVTVIIDHDMTVSAYVEREGFLPSETVQHTYTLKIEEALEEVDGSKSAGKPRKVVREGVLYIEMPDGTTYTATGARK